MEFRIEAIAANTEEKCEYCGKELHTGETVFLSAGVVVVGLYRHGIELFDEVYCKSCGEKEVLK